MIIRKIIYFEEGGSEHTAATIEASKEAALELGIQKVIIASTSGDSAVKAAEQFKDTGIKVIVVGHQHGFPVPGQRFKQENIEKLEILGVQVCLGSDILTNSIRQREKLGHSPLSIITQALTIVKIKVNVEVVLKATEAGLISSGERVISIAGSHIGLDTAVVLEAQDSAKILDIKLREILVMPLSREKADVEYLRKRAQTSNP
jgi:hypothetical protein